jgi:exodeoxyribonuclease-5
LFTDHEPAVLFTEIHRQARENPIVEMADILCMGGQLAHGLYGESKVISRSKVEQSEVLEAGQVPVGTNKTRRKYNRRLRELKGYAGQLPSQGDKMVCLAIGLKKASSMARSGTWRQLDGVRTTRCRFWCVPRMKVSANRYGCRRWPLKTPKTLRPCRDPWMRLISATH